MSDDLPNRQTIRLLGYDYSQNGYYFVTVCVQNRENVFGEIVNGKMVLNDVGKMIDKFWHKIPTKFFGVKLNEYQIMPDHLHGIIVFVGAHPCVRPKNIINNYCGQTHGSCPYIGNHYSMV